MNLIWEAMVIYFFFYLWNKSVIVDILNIKIRINRLLHKRIIESTECAFCSGFWVSLIAFILSFIFCDGGRLWLSVFVVPVMTLFLDRVFNFLNRNQTYTSTINYPSPNSFTRNEGAADDKDPHGMTKIQQ